MQTRTKSKRQKTRSDMTFIQVLGVERHLKNSFKVACALDGLTMREVLLRLVRYYVNNSR